ncbi:class I SAM-dependent methyltransferase [Williamsia sp. DF01-3]|uniref:class I SAM-dependent methyltransferase n=1 Tax=Williamsia sp. DF01-3 TaxID=2934157 RepID=UPI001FF28326|nr:class I SAM-dependent methyltransferase [Williamsia sp. DF01-3]MCK0518903.1 methyltransferase domain-containing protein [Williamsia sp. DF01-3]
MATDTTTTTAGHQTNELKMRHRAMWASGDYPAVATEVISALGETLVAELDLQRGDRVLDVAAGSGNASVPAARVGAEVVAADLAPELFEAGRVFAAEQGVQLTWQEADAEALPFADNSFDVVMSCVGVMFAPDHQRSAAELVRVCRPGGRIGLISWTPGGFVGRMFATMKPYAPAPPPGAQPPPLWGDETHVRELFGDHADITAERRTLTVDRFQTPEEFRRFFKATYGPTIAVYKANAADPAAVAALDDGLDDLARDAMNHDGVMEWEYLLVTATVR